MNDSSNSTISIIVGSTERNSTWTAQWYNAGSRCRGTCILPYAYWDSECQSERAPAWRENAFCNCVLDRTERDTAGIVRCRRRMKEVEGGRRLTKGCRGTVRPRKRWAEKSATGLSAQSGQLAEKEWFFCSTQQLFQEIVILSKNWSILNDIAITTVQLVSRNILRCSWVVWGKGRKNLARSGLGGYRQPTCVAHGDLLVKCICCLSRGARMV